MNKQPLVSVLLPVGRDRRFLAEAVGSIKKQSYKSIELLVGEDKDGDGITKTLIKLANKANGKFLARMDADDICELDRIEKQVEFLVANPSVMLVGSWATLIDESGKEIGVQKMPVNWVKIKELIFSYNPLIHPSWMMRRKWFLDVGGYNAVFKFSQDWEFLLRTVWKYRIENIPQPLVQLRIHKESSSFSNNRDQVWYGIRSRWEAIRRKNVPSWKILYLFPKLFSLIIPANVKYLYRKII